MLQRQSVPCVHLPLRGAMCTLHGNDACGERRQEHGACRCSGGRAMAVVDNLQEDCRRQAEYRQPIACTRPCSSARELYQQLGLSEGAAVDMVRCIPVCSVRISHGVELIVSSSWRPGYCSWMTCPSRELLRICTALCRNDRSAVCRIVCKCRVAQ